MIKKLITESIAEDIADAIRARGNISGTIKPVNYEARILEIEIEKHYPVKVNIEQSAHQTITVTPSITASDLNSSTTLQLPTQVTLTATITPDDGYVAGTLNHTTVNANWGTEVTFSATAATPE